MEYKGYRINIEQSEYEESPIECIDSSFKIIMFMRKYRLGQKHSYADMDDMIEDYAKMLDYDEYTKVDDKFQDGEISVKEYWSAVKDIFYNNVTYFNIYAYIHSGITISTSPFSDAWDSGMVGIIFISKDDGASMFKTVEDAKNAMLSIIDEYDDWVSGNCWYGRIEKDGEEIYCDGWIGDMDDFEDELKKIIDFMGVGE